MLDSRFKTMKIAIFHNFLDNIGGAEKLVLTLARELGADIYTTNIDREKISLMGFESSNIHSIGWVPTNAPQRQQLTLWRFRQLNLKRKYDFYIIAGDWAFSAAVNHKPNLWYIHSPIREIWDLKNYTKIHSVPWYAGWFFDLWVNYNRHLSKKYTSYVNHFVCNSKNTQSRIKVYLEKKAEVIYPPIDTKKFYYRPHKNYWLSVNRLITHKRIDIQLNAFAKMPKEKLIIVGSYEQSRHFLKYASLIKKLKPPNVTIKHWVSEEELRKLYAYAKGFITTALDEDFGMSAVEALSSGKPVISPNEGGYRETLTAGKTGCLLDQLDEKKLIKAIEIIGKDSGRYENVCLQEATKYDTAVFVKSLRRLLRP